MDPLKTYACVRFLTQIHKDYFAPVSQIKKTKNSECIKPKNYSDFDRTHKYYVKFCTCESEYCTDMLEKTCFFSKAFIVLLAESKAAAEEKINTQTSRLKIPKITYSSSSDIEALEKHSQSKKTTKDISSTVLKDNSNRIKQKYKQKHLLERRKVYNTESLESCSTLQKDNDISTNSTYKPTVKKIKLTRINSISSDDTTASDEAPNTKFNPDKPQCSSSIQHVVQLRPSPNNEALQDTLIQQSPSENNNRHSSLTDFSPYSDKDINNRQPSSPIEDRENVNVAENIDSAEELSPDEGLPLLKTYKRKLFKNLKNVKRLPAPNTELHRRYEVIGNKVYLGLGIKVGQVTWHIIKKKKKDIFLRDLSSVICKNEILAKRCLDVKKTKFDDVEPVTPKKLELLLSLYKDFLDEKNVYDEEHKTHFMREATKTLTSHIRDVRLKLREKAKRI